MSGRARAKRICQAAISVFVNPQGVALKLAADEIGDAFDRLFPEPTDTAQLLLSRVLEDFNTASLDADRHDHLSAAATDLFKMARPVVRRARQPRHWP